MGSPASKRKMLHDWKDIKKIRGRGPNLSSQLASGHRCQIKPLSQPLSLLKVGKWHCWGFLFYYCWYFLGEYILKNKTTSMFVTQNCLVRKWIAKYHSCDVLFTLVLGTAQCKAASKLVCHLVAMSSLRVTNNFFFPLLSCSVSFVCFFCLLLCSLGQCLLYRWWGQQWQRLGNFAVPFIMFHISIAQGLLLVVKDSQHWCV